jgi:uncharacterized cupin superfamily protein
MPEDTVISIDLTHLTSAQTTLEHATGNAQDDSRAHRGWFVGSFVPDQLGLRSTGDVEIKWGVHEAGDGQDEWTMNTTATTISILVRGKDKIVFPDGEVLLEHEGDYAIWSPGVPHRWQALEPCVVISVRWPSSVNDAVEVPQDQLRSYLSSLRR